MFKDEKIFLVKVKGASPLIMHNSSGADPDNRWTRELAPLKAKRKKTDNDHQEIRDLSFLSSLYWSEDLNGLYMPVDNIRKMILEAARGCDQRGAKKQVVGIRFDRFLGWPLEVPNRSNLNALKNDPSNRYFKIVTIQKSKVPSTRAIFKSWSFDMEIIVDCSIVNPSTVETWLDYGGARVGVGCRRPYGPTPGEFGKFYIEEFKEIKR